MNAKLKKAYEAVRAAERALTDEIVRQYPAQARVYYDHGGKEIGPVVVLGPCNRSNQLKVSNHSTGKEYWVDVWRITRKYA